MVTLSPTGQPPIRPPVLLIRIVWCAVVVLALIGVGAAIGRSLNLGRGIGPPTADPMEVGFAQHPALTFLHIVPGALFMVLGPLQFVRRIRSRYPDVHRWSGRMFVAASLVIGVSGLVMGVIMPIGGATETAAVLVFGTIFLVEIGLAVYHVRRREIGRHREWMVRAFAIGLGIATIRPIVALFFVLTRLPVHEFFGIAFWLGFTLHAVAAELWIAYTRPSRQARIATEG